jgi:hypothetical protein
LVGKLAEMQKCILNFILKEYAGKASVGVAALPDGERVCKHWQETRASMLGESDRKSKLHLAST